MFSFFKKSYGQSYISPESRWNLERTKDIHIALLRFQLDDTDFSFQYEIVGFRSVGIWNF